MGKYLLLGYTNVNEESDFHFVAPIYRSEGKLFLSVPDKNGFVIKEFIQYYSDKVWVPLETNITETEGDDAEYLFIFKGEVVHGTKPKIITDLYKILRSEKLHPLIAYDIYYFLGDCREIEITLQQFIKENSTYISKADVFLHPPIQKTNIEEFAFCLNMYATVLHRWSAALSYDRLFSRRSGLVIFFNYAIKASKLKGSFDYFLAQYSLPEYRDLVVHCFIQCDLQDASVKTNPDYKFRKLIPVVPGSIDSYYYDEDLLRNTQSMFRISSNALELSCVITKEISHESPPAAVVITDEGEKKYYQLIEKIKETSVWQ